MPDGEAAIKGDDNEEADDAPGFDGNDWVDPEASRVKQTAPGVHALNHGDGDDQMRRESLTDAQAGAVIEHSSRLRSLRQAQEIFTDIGGALGASLNDTVNKVIHLESKRFNIRMHDARRPWGLPRAARRIGS